MKELDLKPTPETERVTYFLSPEITERIRILAAKEKRSRSEVAQDFLLRGGVLKSCLAIAE